jgi:flavin reductase (DIM6/NTAB) family NADH-FMN oxidoreductase RutF
MALECRVKSYDPESCRLVGEIVNVCADESVLTEGKIDPAKLRPITYDPAGHGYYVLGELVGRAFSDGLKIKKG